MNKLYLIHTHLWGDINHTNIALIPKKKKPESLHDFRYISLCNVVMKLVTKYIADCLKPILPSIISPAQSTFIPGRLITNNALIAFELFHTMKTNNARNLSCFVLKLDMSKAYDRVEWSFLIKVMTQLGFCNSFISLIERCITTVSYSIVLMVGLEDPSCHLVVCDRGTLYLHISLFSVLRLSPLCSPKLSSLDLSMAPTLVSLLLLFPTYFLQMIV